MQHKQTTTDTQYTNNLVIPRTYTSTPRDPSNYLPSTASRRHSFLISLTRIPFLVLNSTCLTNLSLLGNTLCTRPKGHLFFSENSEHIITKSPSRMFLSSWVHLYLRCNNETYSLDQRLQNTCAK
ncbi:unnamed protein product [Schistosoma bovis]|nr:unnamed protein product [Schistosoma bovis]